MPSFRYFGTVHHALELTEIGDIVFAKVLHSFMGKFNFYYFYLRMHPQLNPTRTLSVNSDFQEYISKIRNFRIDYNKSPRRHFPGITDMTSRIRPPTLKSEPVLQREIHLIDPNESMVSFFHLVLNPILALNSGFQKLLTKIPCISSLRMCLAKLTNSGIDSELQRFRQKNRLNQTNLARQV